MAEKLQLAPNEVILMEAENIRYSGLAFTDTLVLTNINLYLIRKGMLGATLGRAFFSNSDSSGKEILTFPLNQIKMYDGRPAVNSYRSNTTLTGALRISFLDKEAKFEFQSYTKTTVNKWIKEIYSILAPDIVYDETGEETNMLLGIVGGLGKGLRDVTKTALESTGASKYIDKALGNTAEETIISMKCHGCGSTLSGNKGDTVTCPYCDTKQILL